MVKFVYIVLLSITSFFLFIFSKDKVETVYNSKAIGRVELIKDSADMYLGIKTNDNKVLFPSSMASDVVLTAGQQVIICFAVDSLFTNSGRSGVPVHIGSISYMNQ